MADDERKSPLKDSMVWSPHSAALHRRRKLGEDSKSDIIGSLSALDLEDDEDFLAKAMKSPPKSTGHSATRKKKKLPATLRESARKKLDAELELQERLQNVSPEIRAKLAKVFNKETPMKERLELEVEMMRNPEESKILTDFRYKVDRKQFNLKILETTEAQQELLDRNLKEEAKRAKGEEMEMARKRREKVEAEIARQERELEIERQIKVHKAKNIAIGAEELRREAEKTAEAVLRNKLRKEEDAKARERRIQEFLDGPGKDMTDVERELKIARMLNNGEL